MILLDKFRLKFRELFSSCCCCLDSILKAKSTSSAIIQFKALNIAQENQHLTLQYIQKRNRYSKKPSDQQNGAKISNTSNGSIHTHTSSNHSSNIMSRRSIVGAYNNNGPITVRLTNV